jgi:hypothetical protein
MQKTVVILAAVLAIHLCVPGFAQKGAPEIKNETFVAKILTPLSASANKKGDKFTLQVLEPAAYKEALIEAEVTKSKAAGKVSGKSELLFSFNTLTLNNGTTLPITADLTSVSNSKGVADVDEEGRVIGILGGIGAAVGAAVGGASGAVKGAAIGAAIGLTITFSTRGEDIKFAPGSQFKLVVNTKNK